jgi:beta-lactamase class A
VSTKRLRLQIDGASRGNPGPAALGVVVYNEAGRVLAEIGEPIGVATNNVAEYHALLRALDEARARRAAEVEIRADSDLLVRQISGEYKVKSPNLAPLHARALQALSTFAKWKISHVPRDKNAAADALANRALDAEMGNASPRGEPARDMHALGKQLERVAAGLDGTIGIGVKSTWDGAEFYIEPDRRFPTASVFKIPVLLELLMQAHEGRVSLDERVPVTEGLKSPGSGVLKELTSAPALSLSDLAMLMIIISDNTATDVLVSRVTADAINARLASWGFEVTRAPMDCRQLLFDLAGMPRGPFTPEGRLEVERILKTRERVFTGRAYSDIDNNLTTPREMVRVVEMLVTDRPLPARVREQALHYMRKQQVRDRLPLHLPPGTDIAHKTGSIGGVRNDAGILFGARGPVLVCAFTRDLRVDLEGAAAIAEVGRLVHGTFG